MTVSELFGKGKYIILKQILGLKDNPKTLIRDRVIDGIEFQLVKRENIFDAFEEIGVELTLRDRDNIKKVLTPVILDLVDLKSIQEIFAKLGINEDIPISKMLRFELLDGG